MLQTPSPSNADGRLSETGFGWNVTQTETGYEWVRDGALRDTAWAVLILRPDGTTVSVTFNSVPDTSGGPDSEAAKFSSHVIAERERTIDAFRKATGSGN
jgi:hypothetical protein